MLRGSGCGSSLRGVANARESETKQGNPSTERAERHYFPEPSLHVEE
jgi:ribosomal protein L34E